MSFVIKKEDSFLQHHIPSSQSSIKTELTGNNDQKLHNVSLEEVN
jgi:hypothetical protein